MAGEAAGYVVAYDKTIALSAAATDIERNMLVVPFAGVVSLVQYVPDTVLTGANTESRTLVLVNKGQAGAGTTIVATKAFTVGVNAAVDTPTVITLSATPANLVVAAGDVLAWQSTHVGSTGLADPGGMAHIELSRVAGS